MNNKANIFNFHNNQIRIIEKDGEPWFVVTDVFNTLSYPKGSRTYQMNQLGAFEKGVLKIQTPRGAQDANIISESGLYKLIMRSNKPEAKEFQNWVTQVVLPAIRKDGAYVQGKRREGRKGEGMDCY